MRLDKILKRNNFVSVLFSVIKPAKDMMIADAGEK